LIGHIQYRRVGLVGRQYRVFNIRLGIELAFPCSRQPAVVLLLE